MFLEDGALRAENDLHRPVHAVDAVAIADSDGGAAIGSARVGPVDWGDGDPVVRDGEVEFLAEGSPCAAIGDDRLLD